MADEKELTGKVALITGAGRGIGKEIAITLGKLGAIVVGVGTDQEKAEIITQYLKELDLLGQGFVMNVTDNQSIETAIGQITEKFGSPDILINNAGITRDNLMLRMKDEEWDAVINTNLNSVFRVTKACLRQMVKKRWGRIVSIASVVGCTGNPGQVNYSAAKAGLIAFSKSLAKEVAKRGVTVNCVAPGFIETQMTQAMAEKHRNQLLETIPMSEPGYPEDVAYGVSMLTSPRAKYITGQTIHVNGGMYMV
jgi:3-oxoacyl-[acyl-carrier protein] reductase